MKAHIVFAQPYPKALYIFLANNGNVYPNKLRNNAAAATELAANRTFISIK